MPDIEQVIDAAKIFKVKGYSFEEFSMEAMLLDEDNLVDHIEKQAAASTYYGALYKAACLEYEDLKTAFEYRHKEMYSAADTALAGNKKITIKDIEAKILADNSVEIRDWQTRLSAAKKKMYFMEVFNDGWKQKSYLIKSYVELAHLGLIKPPMMNGDTPAQNFGNDGKVDRMLRASKSNS